MAMIQIEVERRKVRAALLNYGMEIAKIPSVTLDDQVIEWAAGTLDSIVKLLNVKTGSDNAFLRKAFLVRYDKAKHPETTNKEIAEFFDIPELTVRELLKNE